MNRPKSEVQDVATNKNLVNEGQSIPLADQASSERQPTGLLPCPNCNDCWALQDRPQEAPLMPRYVRCGRCGFNAPYDTWQARTDTRHTQRSGFPCALCGGPHDFDTSVPSAAWNRVIRAKGLPEYLCATCIVREFVRASEGFTAQLYNEEFSGVPIEVVVNGKNANDAALVAHENTAYRVRIEELENGLAKERERCAEVCDDIARSNSKGTFNDNSREVRAAEECAAAIRATTQPENDRRITTVENHGAVSSLTRKI